MNNGFGAAWLLDSRFVNDAVNVSSTLSATS